MLSCPADLQVAKAVLAVQANASFSEEQISDLLYLRQLCIIRRGQLANERKAQVLGFPAECFTDTKMPFPTDNMIQLHQIANLLRDNGSEDFRVWGATLCACMRGVRLQAVYLCILFKLSNFSTK